MHVHKGHRTLIELSLLELHALNLFRNFVLYTWHSRACVSATSTVYKINDYSHMPLPSICPSVMLSPPKALGEI